MSNNQKLIRPRHPIAQLMHIENVRTESIQRMFPEKSEAECREIAKAFMARTEHDSRGDTKVIRRIAAAL